MPPLSASDFDDVRESGHQHDSGSAAPDSDLDFLETPRAYNPQNDLATTIFCRVFAPYGVPLPRSTYAR